MNQQQATEIKFWKNLIKAEGAETFKRRRIRDYYNHMSRFDGNADPVGTGLEVGSGCYSMLNCIWQWDIYSIDPLANEYNQLCDEVGLPQRIVPVQASGEETDFADDFFSWVVCWNVIDHTPDPGKMAQEMYRVLKPGSPLYFQVNFDDWLSPAHYALWDRQMVADLVDSVFGPPKWESTIRNNQDAQDWFYGVYYK